MSLLAINFNVSLVRVKLTARIMYAFVTGMGLLVSLPMLSILL